MSSFLSNDGTAYELNGPEDASVVVLIHGLGLCRHIWAGYIPELSKEYRVLSYDLYGHGDSAPSNSIASLAIYSNQIVSLLDELNIEKAAIVGFSIGGMINRRFALDHPDRLTSLAILNSPHDRGKEAQKQVEARAATVRDQGALATMDAALKRWFTSELRETRPEVMQRVIDWREKVDAESYAQAAWVLAAGVTELINPNPPVIAPTLVLTCENDSGSTPAMSYAIAKEIAGAETVIVPHLQHLGLMERTNVFTTPVLDFLERTLP